MSGPPVAHIDATGSSDFKVRPAQPDDEPAIEAMFLECFGTPRSRRKWRWRWFGASRARGDALILESDGAPIGHWAGSTADMWHDGRRERVLLGGEVMVRPQYRRRGGMGMLITAAREIAVAHADVWIGFATDDASRVTAANGGGRVIGRMPMWVVWPRSFPHLPAPANYLAARLLAGWRALVFFFLPCAVTEILTSASWSEVDALALTSASYAGCIRIRDAAYLRWRWLERPEGQVTVFASREKSGRLTGWAVIGVESGGRRIGRVLDLLASDRASLRGLMRRSLKDLTADDCEVITCDYLDPRRWPRSVLRVAGFASRPGKTMTALRMSPEDGRASDAIESWYLTRGDTDVS